LILFIVVTDLFINLVKTLWPKKWI